MIKTILTVEGMTCASCKEKLESSISRIKDVQHVEAIVSKNKLIIHHDNQLVLDLVKNEIDSTGYQVATTKANGILRTGSIYFLLIILAYFILRYENRFSFDFIPNIRQAMGYSTLFLIGILTSLHCVAMCGGINISQCSKHVTGSKLKPSLLYNTGRLVSYTLIGAIIGGIGTIINLTSQSKGYLTLLVSVIMIMMSLKMLKLLHINLPKIKTKKSFITIETTLSDKSPFFVGLANGFMPCGPLQSMQLYALGTGSIIIGGLSMFYFSLGTFPLMFGLGFASTFLNNKFSKKILALSGILVFILAVSMFSRALSLSGYVIPFENYNNIIESSLEDNIQIVEFDLSSNKYEPIKVIRNIPVKLIINATPETLNGCNNSITIPKLNVTANLKPGINIIEFTPNINGKIVYTCWMGMISSYIDVIDD